MLYFWYVVPNDGPKSVILTCSHSFESFYSLNNLIITTDFLSYRYIASGGTTVVIYKALIYISIIDYIRFW